MANPERKEEPTQQTQPKGKDEDGKPHPPVEIPVPRREFFDQLLKRVAKGSGRTTK